MQPFLSRLFIFQTRYSLRILLEWVTWEYITCEHLDSMMENNVMYSFNQCLSEIGLLENILLVSILKVWWKTISCTASTSVYLKCADIVTWDVVLNVIFMFAISPWVFWGELYCVFLWTPNGKEYKFLLVCHRNLFCIFSNLSQILSECLVVLELPFINYDCSAGSLLIKSCCASLVFKWIPCEYLMNFLWSSYAVLRKFLWSSYEVPMKFSWFW